VEDSEAEDMEVEEEVERDTSILNQLICQSYILAQGLKIHNDTR